MIDAAVDDLRPLIGEVAACSAVGACRSGRRRRYPLKPRATRPRPAPDRALSEAERAAVLKQLNRQRGVGRPHPSGYVGRALTGRGPCVSSVMDADHPPVRNAAERALPRAA